MIQHATCPLPTPVPGELWQTTLHELRLQMTKVTYNTWLADSYLLTTASTPHFWVIVVCNEFAWEWLTHRLCPVVERTVNGLMARPVTVCFIPRTMRYMCYEAAQRSPSRICFDAAQHRSMAFTKSY